MARSRRRVQAAPPSESRMRQITAAFDQAAGGEPAQTPAPTKPAKRKRTNVLSDDEEDDDGDLEMVAVVDRDSGACAAGGGGFLPEPGGFLADENVPMAGGFLSSGDGSDLALGGFVTDEPFVLDDSEPQAGGFVLDDSEPAPGGFMLDDSEPALDPSFDYGALSFLPPLPPFIYQDDARPPPASRIPLKSIPEALATLNLPSDSHELLAMFADAASDDEDGVPSVARARFVEACSALLGSDSEDEVEDPEEDDEEPKSDSGEDSDVYVEDAPPRKNAPRRATRANPNPPVDKGKGREIEEVLILSSSEDSAVESDDEAPASRGRAKASAKGDKGKSAPTRTRRARQLTQEELKEAEDSYDLFFEGSARAGKPQRTIGLGELKNVAALLNEKLSDEDLLEMLEYAGRDGGVVDLAAFTAVLAEAL